MSSRQPMQEPLLKVLKTRLSEVTIRLLKKDLQRLPQENSHPSRLEESLKILILLVDETTSSTLSL